MAQRIVNLDINDNGSWRRVSSFDLDSAPAGDLEDATHRVLSLSDNAKLRARLIIPGGDTAPLMTWTRGTGWVAWRGQ